MIRGEDLVGENLRSDDRGGHYLARSGTQNRAVALRGGIGVDLDDIVSEVYQPCLGYVGAGIPGQLRFPVVLESGVGDLDYQEHFFGVARGAPDSGAGAG
jgi:hypothetical protein